MDYNIRENIGLAVDGGGIKGAVVARGLIELEKILGVERLIDEPRLKVIAGTSTGALLTALIAAGFRGEEILKFYYDLGGVVFSKAGPFKPGGKSIPLLGAPTLPNGLVKFIEHFPLVGEVLRYYFWPARYSFDPLRKIMRDLLKQYPTPNTDPTLGEVGEHLREKRHGSTLIFTAADVTSRRTHFLKTTEEEQYKHMKLVDALLASSCIPLYWEPIALPDPNPPQKWLVDGGLGSFGNPALVVAWEMCDKRNPDKSRHYDPKKTTIYSFGTGTLPEKVYRESYGVPVNWWAINWAARAVDIFGDTAIREQSRNIVTTYEGIDLRRFQVAYDKVIKAQDFSRLDKELKEKGEELQQLIRENRHALQPDPNDRNDPEGIWLQMLRDYVGIS